MISSSDFIIVLDPCSVESYFMDTVEVIFTTNQENIANHQTEYFTNFLHASQNPSQEEIWFICH